MPSPNLRLLGLHRSPHVASNLLWLILLISVTGCRPDRRSHGANDSQATPAHPEVEAQAAAQPAPEGPSASLLDNEFAELQRNAQGTVRLIQITEINRDSLPNLQEDYEFYSEDLVRYEHGGVVVSERHSEDRQYKDDSTFEDFELANESVGSIVTTARLADCQLFVRYVVIYEGTGREGESVQWYGFHDLNGQFAADFVQPMNEVTYDPSQDVPPFAIWLEQLRLGTQSTIGDWLP